LVALEQIGDDVFADMQNSNELSLGKTTIDPDSDLLVKKELIVNFVIVPMGTLGEITGTINIKNSL
ncbi:MAG: hypothetical protein RSD53_08095, partial [Algoriella sp.]